MLIAVSALFLLALTLSVGAIVTSVMQSWSKIEAVVASRGMPVERTVRVGPMRYTGARVRVVSDRTALITDAKNHGIAGLKSAA